MCVSSGGEDTILVGCMGAKEFMANKFPDLFNYTKDRHPKLDSAGVYILFCPSFRRDLLDSE